MVEEAIEIKNQEVFDHLGKFEGPIPGQSLTSNPDEPQAWEQPPENVTLDSALYGLFSFMTQEDVYPNIVQALGDGMPITGMTQMILEDGFQKGSWNPDLMLQLVEPTMYMIMSMAEKSGVKYKIDEDDDPDVEELGTPEEIEGLHTLENAIRSKSGRIDESVIPEEIKQELEQFQPESLLQREQQPIEEIEDNNSLLARG